jgi:hypothetical protein
MSSADADLPEGLRAFVDEDVALLPTGLTDADRAALIVVLVDRGDVARLDRLGASPDKALAKAARRALHQLRTRGVEAPAGPRVYRVVGPYAEPPPASYASVVDGRGERVVWYVEAGESGPSVFEAELSETAGIMSLTAVEVSRRAWREQVTRMKKNDRALVGEVSGAHARALIARAYRAMLAAGRSPPEAYASAHRRLQVDDAALDAPHPARDLPAGPPTTDADLAALFQRPELQLSIPPQETFAALDTAIGEVVESKLEVTEAERQAQIEAAVLRVADETLTPALRERLADRFLELALVVASRSPDEAGFAAARACVVAADRARDASIKPSAHPTLRAMFLRVVPDGNMFDTMT